LDDLESGLERERPDVLEALKSMNWEERLEKAREKRKAALSRKTNDPKAPVIRGVDAADMLKRAEAADLAPLPAAGERGFPSPIDERTLRGQTPVVSPGLASVREDPVEPRAPGVSAPTAVVAADSVADVPSAPRPEPGREPERSVAAKIGFGFGLGIGIGTSVVAVALLFTRGGPSEFFAAPAPAVAPSVSAFPPTRPIPALPGAVPDVSALAVAAVAPSASESVPLAPPAGAGALPSLVLPGGSPQIAALAPERGVPRPVDDLSGIRGLARDRAGVSFVAGAAPSGLGLPGRADARPAAIGPAGVPVVASRAPALAGATVSNAGADIGVSTPVPAVPLAPPTLTLASTGGQDRVPRIATAPLSRSPAIQVTLVAFDAPSGLPARGALSTAIQTRPAAPDPADFAEPASGGDPGLRMAALEPPRALPEADAEPLVPGADSVFVHLNAPETVPDGDIGSVTAGLAEAGVALSKVREVSFKVSETQVRYFHARDAAAAGALADLFGGRARNFTDFRPSPPDGTLEVYLAGDRVAPPPPARAAPRRAQPSAADLLRDRIVQRLRRGDHL